MKQLGIIDSAFINLENPTVPQHVGGLGIYDPSTAPGGFVRFKDVLANFEQRLQKLPIFRTRLVEVPLGLDRPYWVLDPNFDVEFHIRHIALPKPGDWRQLCIQVARLHSRPIDMKHPLWEAYIIEGLDNIPDLPPGSFAVYTKMHHSLVDGAGSQNFMAVIHDLEPVPSTDSGAPSPAPRMAELRPSDVQLLTRTVARLVPNALSKMRSSARLAGSLASTVFKMAREELPSAQMSGPKTRFDEPVGPNRVFEACLFDLQEIKAMKDAAGLTINDIAVGIVAGALRQYLQAHAELPDEPLLASMPVNMRTRVGETEDNNQVGSMSAPIHTNIADPIERLHAIKKGLDDAKAYIETPFVDVIRLPGVFAPAISKPLTRFYVRNRLTRYLPMGVATVITNVPGPPFALYCAGARLMSYYPLGLLNPGLGCFHAVFSCSGKLSITVLADRNQMPDPEFYRSCIESSHAELRKALLGDAHARAPASVKRPARPRAKAATTARAKARKSRPAAGGQKARARR